MEPASSVRPLKRLLILSPFAVFPPRSGGHSAVLEPARFLARAGIEITLFCYGTRRFEALRYLRPFTRSIENNLIEYRFVSFWNLFDYLLRRRNGIPAYNAAKFIARSNPAKLQHAFSTADIVQYESPWIFGYCPARKPRVLIVHNFETKLLEHIRISDMHRTRIASKEQEAWRQAEVVICFTTDDRDGMSVQYGHREAFVVPLGVDAETIHPPAETQRSEARRKLGVEGRFVVLFTGSWHLANRKALALMQDWSHSIADSDLLWVAAGSVGDRAKFKAKFIQTGALPALRDWFQAADCAINPLTEGSGMNVKMLEYMAYGLPVVSSPVGARGIAIQDGVHALIRAIGEFPQAVAELKARVDLRRQIAQNARLLAEEHYAWSAIGTKRLSLLQSLMNSAR